MCVRGMNLAELFFDRIERHQNDLKYDMKLLLWSRMLLLNYNMSP